MQKRTPSITLGRCDRLRTLTPPPSDLVIVKIAWRVIFTRNNRQGQQHGPLLLHRHSEAYGAAYWEDAPKSTLDRAQHTQPAGAKMIP